MAYTQKFITEVATSRGWELVEHAERTGYLGALDEWHRDGNAVQVFYGAGTGVRKGWAREGNRDWYEINGQNKAEKIVRYLKTGYLS